jgi:TonB family protein
MFSRRALLCAAAATAVLRADKVGAAEERKTDGPKVFLFNISAQSLQSALIAYAAVVGRQLMYDPQRARSLRSQAVVGLFTADTALRMLIADTGLTIVPTGTDVALVPWATVRANAAQGVETDGETTFVLDTLYISVPPGAEQHPDYTGYGQLVRNQILKTLSNDPRTAKHVFSVQVDIWVAPSGAITETRMARSSGRNSFDAVLQQAIEGIVVSRGPPSGMRQPIHVTVIGV